MASFKLDISALPRLESDGSNFLEWRSLWEIAFRYFELYDLISGDFSRPKTKEEQKNWDTSNNKVMVMLLSAAPQHTSAIITTSDGYASTA